MTDDQLLAFNAWWKNVKHLEPHLRYEDCWLAAYHAGQEATREQAALRTEELLAQCTDLPDWHLVRRIPHAIRTQAGAGGT